MVALPSFADIDLRPALGTSASVPDLRFPPSFNPANVVEKTINQIREQRKRAMESPQK
mgnify:CR=1 FL=1